MRLWLGSMDDVGKLDGILYEEYGNVIGDNVPVALLRVEFDGKTTDITDGVGAASTAKDGREADKDGRLPRGVSQDRGIRDVLGAFEETERSKSTASTGVDNTFGNALMIKTMNLEKCYQQSQCGNSP